MSGRTRPDGVGGAALSLRGLGVAFAGTAIAVAIIVSATISG